ncbi:hypothetical protein L1D29_12340 [Shewanella insulae]|uniref:hypothetical protein n=1 Tax=Shewanella insulae TaxID=2681496 RepID=UPI001EFCEE09|nr:hypothetical protein [Shewanella insulae]MCG9713605.1 hypothetical protein [Shewanella insulae]
MKKSILLSACAIAILSACSHQAPRSGEQQVAPEDQVQLSEQAQLSDQVQLNDLANTLKDRWQLGDEGITWQVQDTHEDHIEMSGEQISAIIYYGSDEQGQLILKRKLVWPMLRTVPNNTHASLIHDFPLSISPEIMLGGKPVSTETLERVTIDGTLNLTSQLSDAQGSKVSLSRTLSPSTTGPRMIERLRFTNQGDQTVTLELKPLDYKVETDADKGVYGRYLIQASSDNAGQFSLAPGSDLDLFVTFEAHRADKQVGEAGPGQERAQANDQTPAQELTPAQEISARLNYVAELNQNLRLETPDPVLNKMFEFAKLRSAESIFRTKGGLMHGPGGGRYYAAIWANDQAEYINPFFPFLGDKRGNESAINSFAHFARYMNDEGRAIPSSIIAEGDDYWNGAGDRGDCAMIAYGASRFALAYGDKQQARELLPLIDWCIDFSYKKQTQEGVIASDSDELEGRFPAGDVNLSTNMLTYGALISSAYLNQELGRTELASDYRLRAKALKAAIETYFGANVQGFDTYQYYQGNDKLRAWIALPLTFGIFDRKQATLDALLSDYLWSPEGIYSEAGNKTFWDRATLYAFRGIFSAQETDTAMRYFKYYSRKRLLGEHVPYAVEAWPEGNQRHLSAESALYARVVTEGIFGMEPTGFNRLKVAPYLPTGWDNMCLRGIRAFNSNIDLCVNRTQAKGDDAYQISVQQPDGKEQKFSWDGKGPVSLSL